MYENIDPATEAKMFSQIDFKVGDKIDTDGISVTIESIQIKVDSVGNPYFWVCAQIKNGGAFNFSINPSTN